MKDKIYAAYKYGLMFILYSNNTDYLNEAKNYVVLQLESSKGERDDTRTILYQRKAGGYLQTVISAYIQTVIFAYITNLKILSNQLYN